MLDLENGKYIWRKGVNLYPNVDAQKVADEILTKVGEQFEPKDIVDMARDENTESHKCFEWRDDVAAEKYRIQQARTVVRNLVFVKPAEAKNPRQELSFAYRTRESQSYETTRFIFRSEDGRQRLLMTALAELNAFQKKYAFLEELVGVFNAINELDTQSA